MSNRTGSGSQRRSPAAGIAVIVLVAAATMIGISLCDRRRDPNETSIPSSGPKILLVTLSADDRSVTMRGSAEMLSTEVRITLTAPDRAAAEAHIAEAFNLIAALERTLSAHMANSELRRVNKRAGHEPVAVSRDLFEAVRAAVAWHTKSKGAFDVAVGPLIDLWHRCGSENRLPTEEEKKEALSLVGAGRIELDAKKHTVRLPVAGMHINLGGIGKGYCAEKAAELLKRRGVSSALISVAGDMHVIGLRSDGRSWRVGVQDPRSLRSDVCLTTLALSDSAVSTSGNYERFVTIHGRQYSHIVDPRTGLTADNVPSVTVIAPDTVTTDVLGTALSVLGVKEGARLVEAMPGVEALFITFDDKNQPQLTRSSGFAKYESE